MANLFNNLMPSHSPTLSQKSEKISFKIGQQFASLHKYDFYVLLTVTSKRGANSVTVIVFRLV